LHFPNPKPNLLLTDEFITGILGLEPMLQFLRGNTDNPTLAEKQEVSKQFNNALSNMHFDKQSYVKKPIYFHYNRYLSNKKVQGSVCDIQMEDIEVIYLGIQLKFCVDDFYDLSDLFDKVFNYNWDSEYGSWAFGVEIFKDKKDNFYMELSFYETDSEQEIACFEPFDSEQLYEFLGLLINFEADLGCSNMFGKLLSLE
jgi:hypothetical protein